MRLSPELPPTTTELDGYSTAALLALQARRLRGHNTPYDRFLCDYIGAPLPNDARFRPISRRAPSGAVIAYNNAYNMHRSCTRQGTMINVRHAQGILACEDRLAEFFVATADLRTGDTVEWQVTDVRRRGALGKQAIELDLYDGAPVVPLREGLAPDAEVDSVEAVLAGRRLHCGFVGARLVLHQETGGEFQLAGRPAEATWDIGVLVSEVNSLTERYGLDLDELASRSTLTAGHLATPIASAA